MSRFLQKIYRLMSEVQRNRPPVTVFELEGGPVFTTTDDPLTFLLKHGAQTARGRIVGYEPPPGVHDPITSALYEEVRKRIG